MPATTTGQQYDKQHAYTEVAIAAVASNRFIGLDGQHATNAGGVRDSQGVSVHAAAVGEAFPVVTGFTYLVESSAAIAFGDYLRPAADGSGRAEVGTATQHCARARGTASGAGQLVEVRILTHRNA